MLGHETGHLEAVRVRYDSSAIGYEAIARRFFEIHDPTQTNGQGPDIGQQYLSAVFYSSPREKQIADHRPARGPRLQGRHPADRGRDVLAGRGLSPGLLRPQRQAALLPPAGRSLRRRPAGGRRLTVAARYPFAEGKIVNERVNAEIERVRAGLEAGIRPSELAGSLHAAGFGGIELAYIFHRASGGARLSDIKAFSEWWSSTSGVTDADAFDAWAAECLPAYRPK